MISKNQGDETESSTIESEFGADCAEIGCEKTEFGSIEQKLALKRLKWPKSIADLGRVSYGAFSLRQFAPIPPCTAVESPPREASRSAS